MSYLYGDSTPSPLRANFIEFLRHALDLGVYVLSAEQRVTWVRERKAAASSACEAETQRLEALSISVQEALDRETRGGGDSPTVRCAAFIARGTTDAVAKEIEGLRTSMASELARLDLEMLHEHEGCQKAFEALVLRHDLPDMKTRVLVDLQGSGYVARLFASTPYGVDFAIALDIAAASPFAQDVRVERFAEGLEVHAPESGGWIRKEVKIAPHRLGKLHIVSVAMSETETTMKLRSSLDAGASGFDLMLSSEAPQVVMSKVGKEEEGPLGPFEVSEADAGRLLGFRGKVVGALEELSQSRRALLEANLDGIALRDHEHPPLLVERLVQAMAPVVRQIAEHSQSPNELVLRRMVGEDRREEIFVPKAALFQRIESLSTAQRAVFAGLGLDANSKSTPAPPEVKRTSSRPPAMTAPNWPSDPAVAVLPSVILTDEPAAD